MKLSMLFEGHGFKIVVTSLKRWPGDPNLTLSLNVAGREYNYNMPVAKYTRDFEWKLDNLRGHKVNKGQLMTDLRPYRVKSDPPKPPESKPQQLEFDF